MTRALLDSIRVAAPAAVAAALAFPVDALAWEHTGFVWLPDRLPYVYYTSDYDEDSLDPGDTFAAIDAGYAAWDVVECADLGVVSGGVISENTATDDDDENHITFDDPGDDISPGVLAVTYSKGANTPAFIRFGRAYYALRDTDIVFNDNVIWRTDDDIDSGDCRNETSMQAVATHEIGHSFGLDHSCEQTDVCTNPELLDATMYWSAGQCDTNQSSIGSDDYESLNNLYGPSVSFTCNHELQPGNTSTIAIGNVPFTLRCVVDGDRSDLTGATWYFGDGGTETSLDVAHTYTEPGNYSLRACFDGSNDVCGDYQYCARREGYVRACDVPDVAFAAQHVNGRTWEFLNETDLSVYGCIFDVQWDVFSGNQLVTSISAWEPTYTFEENGDYRIVLNVGGPAGQAAAQAMITVNNRRGEGYGACDTGAVPGTGVLALLGLLGLRRRRA